MAFNEWRWETHGPFELTAAYLRSLTDPPIGPTWNRNVQKADRKRTEREVYPIPSIFD